MNNEPVAWKYKIDKGDTKRQCICTDKYYLQQEGVYDIEPLYTHPVKDLTDEEITNLFRAASDHIEFAREILKKASKK